MNKSVRLIILLLCLTSKVFAADEGPGSIEPGIYVLVSFSINDQSLRSYFNEAERYKAKLVMRGFAEDGTTGNMFAYTKAKLEQAGINIDINPVLFDELKVKQVPVIAVVKADGSIKKVAGHIALKEALDIMGEDIK